METIGKVGGPAPQLAFIMFAYWITRGHPVLATCAVQNEKGMQGIDSRVRNTRIKGERFFLALPALPSVLKYR